MNDIFEQSSEKGQEEQVKPEGLKFISILSFLGSGMSLFANAMVFLFYETFINYLSSEEIKEVPMAFEPDLLKNYAVTAGQTYFLLSALLYSMSLLGVYYMWNLYKKGIHFYAIAQISLLILPLIFIDSSLSVLPGLILSGAFIYFYSRYLNLME